MRFEYFQTKLIISVHHFTYKQDLRRSVRQSTGDYIQCKLKREKKLFPLRIQLVKNSSAVANGSCPPSCCFWLQVVAEAEAEAEVEVEAGVIFPLPRKYRRTALHKFVPLEARSPSTPHAQHAQALI